MQGQPDPEADGGWWRRLWRRDAAARPSAAAVAGLEEERRALKAAIQRKRRNDRVRFQELEELRALLRARAPTPSASPSSESGAVPSSPSSVAVGGGARSGWSRVSPDKSRTIEQIARIEAQMTQHWTPRPASAPALRIGAPAASGGRALQAAPPGGLRIDVVGPDPALAQAERDLLLTHPALTEAAVRFANGRLVQARQALESVLAQEVDTPLAHVAGMMLLDWFQANGDVEGFGEWAVEWADRFGQPVPRWPGMVAPAESTAPPVAAEPGAVWVCPPLLDGAAVQALAARDAQGATPRWMDWTDLLSADADAARALTALFEDWAQRPLTLHWRGAAVLRRRLKASTPSGRRDTSAQWWRLRLAALRLLGRRDEFDLVALDYCVTYGEVPPAWWAPVARVELVEGLPEVVAPKAPQAGTSVAEAPAPEAPWPELTTAIALGETEFPALPTRAAGWSVQTLSPEGGALVQLEGALQGDARAALDALDAAMQQGGGAADAAGRTLRIDARRLQRMDFAAAGALLQWLLAARGRGVRVELDGVSHLLAVLFHVVGIDEVAVVRLRQY
ncbi:STAS domain-containing protein [Tepidimonas sp.]|uniref:STAS domain-containing protein n=1 Tax=Tepidimonas sp. TaxID=2002775 RepID=UPI002FE1AD46